MSKLKIPVTAADHSQGSADAPITLVEYGDYQCPHCGRAYPIVKRVQKHFGKRLRFIFRNLHDVLFENQDELGLNLYLSLAAQLNLSGEALEQALENDEFTERVRADFSGGVRSGVNGTPTFFINGQRHDASFDYPDLVAAIDEALAASA